MEMQKLDSDADLIARYLPNPGKTVVDVGCGTGAIVRILAGLAVRAIGVDVPEMLAKAEAEPRVGDELYIAGTGEDLPLEDHLADSMLYLASFHHVPVPRFMQALRECARVLTPGGMALVVEPEREPGSYFDLIRLVEDEREIQKQAYAALLRAEEAGLRLGDESFVYWERSLDDFRQLLDVFVPEPEKRAEYVRQAEELVAERVDGEASAVEQARFRSICRVNVLHKP